MARIVAKHLKPESSVKTVNSVPEERTFNVGQSRRGPSLLIPEYRKIQEFLSCQDKNVDHLQDMLKKEGQVYRGAYIPEGSRVLARVEETGSSAGIPRENIKVGIAWTPHRFVEAAKELTHPLDDTIKVPPSVADALLAQAQLGPYQLSAERESTISWMRQRRQALAKEEQLLKGKLHPEVGSVVQRKQILLFKELLSGMNYDDPGVADLLVSGVKLVGTVERIGIWPPDPSKEAKATINYLWASARDAQKSIASSNSGPFSEKDQLVWDSALEEVSGGFLKGPFSAQELEGEVGALWIAARRFGITQGGKFRPIDDFSEYGVNGAYGLREKAQMKGMDQIVAWSRAWVESQTSDDQVEFTDTSSKRRTCALHPDWGKDEWRNLVGRVADLRKAYKQLPSCPSHKCFAVISAKDPSGQPKFFRALSLMFGTTAAVFAFLRFSRAIAAIANHYLKLITVEFFDDFTQVETEATAESGQWAMEQLLEVLEWDLSTGEDKRKPFAKNFVSLGVLVDFTKIEGKEVTLRNKPGRVEAIMLEVKEILSAGFLDFKAALSLKGKLYFSESQTYGRALAPVSRILSIWASRGGRRKLDDSLSEALKSIIIHFAGAAPRVVAPRSTESPVLVFTDGACEEAFTSVGGAMWADGIVECFGAEIPPEVCQSWTSKVDQTQVIGQAELFPVLVAKLTWKKQLAGRRAIYFLDNESARIALVKAYSPVLPSLKIIMQCLEWDFVNRSDSWYARVPTASNISDGPSRMSLAVMQGQFPSARVVPPVFPDGVPRGKVLS